jgi:hypothetical protein
MTAAHGARRMAVIAALAAIACVVTGCHWGSSDSTPGAKKPSAKKVAAPAEPGIDPAVAEANRTMASGVPMGTSTAPLEVRFDLATVPVPGTPFAVEVAVLPAAPAPVLRLEVTGGEGLSILDPDGPVSFEKVQAGSVSRLHVKASAAAVGTRLVQVRATLELPDGPESRTFAFPVVIGATAPPAPPPAAKPPAKTAKS